MADVRGFIEAASSVEYRLTNGNAYNNNGNCSYGERLFLCQMACVIQECYRVLDTDAMMFMVNDNVSAVQLLGLLQYAKVIRNFDPSQKQLAVKGFSKDPLLI